MGLVCALGAALLASTNAARARPAVSGCKVEAGKQIALTRHFVFAFRVGRIENMYMPYQVRTNHLRRGEVMLRGQMSGPELLSGGPIRHLEIQICDRPTREVVTNANPKIVVKDTTTGKATRLPVAVMEDISLGRADLHYGNNIALPTGHHFRVTASWQQESATFAFTAPP
jgi:hypothetical protein